MALEATVFFFFFIWERDPAPPLWPLGGVSDLRSRGFLRFLFPSWFS